MGVRKGNLKFPDSKNKIGLNINIDKKTINRKFNNLGGKFDDYTYIRFNEV